MNKLNIMPTFMLERQYLKAGMNLADAIEFPGDKDELFCRQTLAQFSEEYQRRGYRAIPLQAFQKAYETRKPINPLLKRMPIKVNTGYHPEKLPEMSMLEEEYPISTPWEVFLPRTDW